MSKYYQLPQSDGPYTHFHDEHTGRGFAFSMRMLNFLSLLKVSSHWKRENQYTVYLYAQRQAYKILGMKGYYGNNQDNQ